MNFRCESVESTGKMPELGPAISISLEVREINSLVDRNQGESRRVELLAAGPATNVDEHDPWVKNKGGSAQVMVIKVVSNRGRAKSGVGKAEQDR